MLPPFEQSGVSKCFSLELFGVNQNWVIHLFLNAFYMHPDRDGFLALAMRFEEEMNR
jgi:hypothetical protein